ncbi:hypothetical protein GE21DRAFT_5928 [Neurospora crassa]|uniref:Rhodopsin domain-containing protein n=1 Tax=Neurospora crassa (strain ATCC 24698 / 74-OR23-1A / CBS 708.71 / DSM 1257 / FGSC 987) TaxID=367110 RepID=Q7SAA3_NEUCR|nr:hypothetical protein NCU06328 [Neurospora crassa OR74A]EAA33354.2 hypothetical protein NCU06328 [Neurospora crassa OR74A]KHE83214.1 hypothetical protein GE21DRAFT_5928 [Neurospora crassa]|eukprot:XP_962590.2 hypothetical protein NCU06328 [Neurospora crassa OR74A]
MAMGGEGPGAITVMWVMVALTALCVSLRLYVRMLLVANTGYDDHVYVLAFILLVGYTICCTIAAHYGFGQNMWDIPPEDVPGAIMWEAIGQCFAVIGMALAKWSLGLFLLRLVTQTWHKVSIWLMMGSLMGASISVCFVFMLQCSPPAYLWDRSIPGGHCDLNATPVSLTLTTLCVIADFFFALMPWIFLWKLNMNQREKMIIAISMSLGVIAGACGIKRTLQVPNLSTNNYSHDTVGLIVWSSAEIAITMICIGIPVCRPLYKSFFEKIISSRNGSGGYQKQQSGGASQSLGLRTIGGGVIPGRSGGHDSKNKSRPGRDDESDEFELQRERTMPESSGSDGLGLHGPAGTGQSPFNDANAISGSSATVAVGRVGGMDNRSEESILGEEYRRGHGKSNGDLERGEGPGPGQAQGAGHWGNKRSSGGKGAVIQVTEEWHVTRE